MSVSSLQPLLDCGVHPEHVLLQDAEHSRRAHRQENSEGACVLRFNGGYPRFLKRLLQRCGSASGFLSSTKTAAPRISESIDWNVCELCTYTYFCFLVSKFSLMFCFSAKIVKTKKARHKGSSDLPHILARSTRSQACSLGHTMPCLPYSVFNVHSNQ